MFSQSYKFAVNRGYIIRNPLVDVIKPKSKKPNKIVRALELEEQQKFTEYLMNKTIEEEPYKNLFLLQMYCGLRVGEACALRNTDINLQKNLIKVDKTLTTSFLNALYTSIPAWDTSVADASDEATGGGSWTNGTITPDSPIWYWPYANIRNCNIFIQNASNPEVCTIDRELADRLIHEARFIRAYLYFEMVKRYGGVPLITVPQEITDDLFVKRNSTEECFEFIINELNACAEKLPDTYDASELGRITKGGVKAFLGRVCC